MFLRIDPAARAPLFEQVAAGIRGALRRGEIEPGERLPSARELAADLDVNMHTVLRAYQILRDDGILELRRGRGAHIARDAQRSTALIDAIDRLVDVSRELGLTTDDLIAAVHERVSR